MLDPATGTRRPYRLVDLLDRSQVVLVAAQARGVIDEEALLDSRGSYPEFERGYALNYGGEHTVPVTLRADFGLIPTEIPIDPALFVPVLESAAQP